MQLSLNGHCGHGCHAEGRGVDRERFQGARAVRETAESYRVETKTDLTVQTAEGDKVTISVEALAQLESASRQGRGGQVSYSRSYSSTEINLEVQGSLSDAELEDISELINALSGAGGQGGDGLDLSTLSAFDFRQTRTVEAGSLFQLAA